MLNEGVDRLSKEAFFFSLSVISVEILSGFSKFQVNDKRSFRMTWCEHASQLILDYTVLEKQFLLLMETVQHHPNFS